MVSVDKPKSTMVGLFVDLSTVHSLNLHNSWYTIAWVDYNLTKDQVVSVTMIFLEFVDWMMVFGLASLTSWNCSTSINDRLVAASETKEPSLLAVYLGCILASRLLQPTSYHYISITGFGMKCPYVWGLLFLFARFQWPPAAHGRLRSSRCLAADSAFLWYDPIGSALYTVHLAFCHTQKPIWYMINVRFSCPKSQNHHPLTSQLTSCHL